MTRAVVARPETVNDLLKLTFDDTVIARPRVVCSGLQLEIESTVSALVSTEKRSATEIAAGSAATARPNWILPLNV